ncbi:FAD binding domain-containing protein [Pseudomonas sp. NPDC007930]|uniref:FAD binding domain-containing protein n=1 Tax=Pseudomonas sp. NPDC007930 TaxID=3364417 RepID=UPI0036E74816
MQPFAFNRAADVAQAVKLGGAASTRFIAGGTTLTDLMKLGVEHPSQVIDINRLPLAQVDTTPSGGLKIGALVRNSDLAWHLSVKQHYPVLSQALLAGASGQLRNMATTGGNLLQRTRCMYFRDNLSPCNKREPGSGCAAIGGANRTLAVFGASEQCIATNPSDMNVALMALEAQVHIQGASGARVVPIHEFFLLPGSTPQVETVLKPGELITHVELPAPVADAHSGYLKLRDRASYEFALASAAVLLRVRNGRVEQARVALGGVGTVPWRSPAAEQALVGAPASPATWQAAAEAAVRGAKAQSENGFKIELAKRCVAHQLATVAALA